MEQKYADILICRTGQGDMAAFEELYNGLSRKVYAFVMTIVKNPAAAEDIMQDTFVRVYNAASEFKGSGSGVSWIMRIARNLAYNTLSRRQAEPEENIDAEKSLNDTESNVLERIVIEQAMETLDENERQIITLHAVVGLRLHEIAQIVNQPLGTVKWRHSAALKKLRNILDESEAKQR